MPPRCFLAVDLARGPLRLLDAADRAFLEHAPTWAGEKWVRSGLRHITLKFIGPIADSALQETLEALTAGLSSFHAFDLSLCGLRAHPSPKRAAMLWAVLHEDDDAASLARTCDRVLTELSIAEPDTRHFNPHITVVRARSRRVAPAAALDAAQSVLLAGKDADRTVSVRSVTLYSSTLGRSGPEYEEMGAVRLGR